MVGKLEGKVAVVTGAGRGIGRAVAELMAAEGAKVVVADNGSLVNGTKPNPAIAEEAANVIREHGGEAISNSGDVGEVAEAESMIADAIDTWGTIDILVNAAGNFRLSTIADILDDDWDSVIRTHLRGTFATTRAAARQWQKTGGPGRVINFTSLAGTAGLPNMVAYSTAKAGIIGLTRATANSLVSLGVTANSISPGAATRMSDRGGGPNSVVARERDGKWPREIADPESRGPANIAPLVVYLASDAAANISGRIFGAWGQKYALLSEHHDERILWSEGPWDLDRLFAEFDTTLAEGMKAGEVPQPLASLDVPLEGDFPHELLG